MHATTTGAPGELVGRQSELGELRRTLVAGIDHGAVLLVTGEPGIGKTALLNRVRRDVEGLGGFALTTVGLEAETAMPFAGLHQLLGPILDETRGLEERQRQAILTALGLEDGPRPSIFLIAEAALALLEARTSTYGRPIVLVVDDVQWLDPPTHEILTFLAHRATSLGLTVLGAARAGHDGPFLSAGFPLVVTGLDDGPAALLLSASSLAPGDRERVRVEARGNPLALLELPRVWRPGATGETVPLSTRLERAFAGRMAELPSLARDALLIAAVGSSDDVGEVQAATSALRGAESTSRALGPAIGIGLVGVFDGRVEFRHPLVRSGVLGAESLVRRQLAHRALSEVLGDHPLRRTWHLAQSIVGPDDVVAEELEESATELLRRGAVMAAITRLERAAELFGTSSVRGHRLLVGAQHAFGMGRGDLVHRLVDEAAQTELTELDWARMQLLREMFDDGTPGDGVRVMELADIARRSAGSGDPGLALDLLLGAALRCWWADTGPAARATVVSTVDALVDSTGDARFVAALAVAEPVLRAGEVSERLASLSLDEVTDPDALRLLGMAAHAIGDTVMATDILDRSETRLREQARLGLLPHVLGIQAHIRHELGDWAGALSAMHEVRRLALETGQPIWSMNNEIVVAHSEALRGDAENALSILVGAEMEATRRRLNDSLCLVQLARGTALLTRGDGADAYACFRRTFDPFDPAHHPREKFGVLGFLAEAAVLSGQQADARGIVEDMELTSAVTPSPILRVHLLYARAVLAPDPRTAALRFHEATEFDLSRWPWPAARLQAAYGRWLVAQGRPSEAADPLGASLRTFEAIGAESWARDVRTLIATAGTR